MSISWTAFVAAFLASLVEFVEALTIVLAVGAVRGWKPAIAGAVGAALLLALLVAIFGPHLAEIDLPIFKIVVGTLLLLFGLRWLRKAVLRSAGIIALHDEAQAYAKETAALSGASRSAGFDTVGTLTAFNGVFIEGVEVVFIVLAVGTGGRTLGLASLGAAAAALVVVALGFAVRGPLTRIPENALKIAVGVLVSAFGTFWLGEGMQFTWPGGDWATIALTVTYAIVAAVGVVIARSASARARGARA